MEIRLLRTFIQSLKLEAVVDLPDPPAMGEHKLRFGPVYREDEEKEFVVLYDLIANLAPNGFILQCKFSAVFETTEAITDDFKKGHFPRVNAAAVGYPYLRAFVSQFSVLSGFDTLTLPVRNFVKTDKPPASSTAKPEA